MRIPGPQEPKKISKNNVMRSNNSKKQNSKKKKTKKKKKKQKYTLNPEDQELIINENTLLGQIKNFM